MLYPFPPPPADVVSLLLLLTMTELTGFSSVNVPPLVAAAASLLVSPPLLLLLWEGERVWGFSGFLAGLGLALGARGRDSGGEPLSLPRWLLLLLVGVMWG